jgi:SAM-dependent methyltransferase
VLKVQTLNKPYQTHADGTPGQTDSNHKLMRLRLPADLSGKRILDIGCNEGFFCNEASRRGAAHVVGIDADQSVLNEARRRYGSERVTFLNQSWKALPDGPFDIVLWTSAMHYELDPTEVLARISSILAPDGVLILECGLHHSPGKEMIYTLRHDGGHWYPSVPFLEAAMLKARLTHRKVSQAELTGTDPVPRVVYHCSRRLPTVMIVRGPTTTGKSNLAALMLETSTKVIALDHFVSRIAWAPWQHTDLEKLIKHLLDTNDLGKVYAGIDEAGLTNAYATLIAKGVADSDNLVVIEGFLTDPQAAALAAALSARAVVWIASRER